MAKPRPIKRTRTYSWSVFHNKGTAAKFVGIIDNATDAETAIERAIEQYQMPPNERGWLMALRLAI
jgi:hypothetical protein